MDTRGHDGCEAEEASASGAGDRGREGEQAGAPADTLRARPIPASPRLRVSASSWLVPPLSGVILCAGLPLALAGMLAAPQVLPMLELSGLSHRAGGALLSPSAESYRMQALPFWAAIVLAIPEFFFSVSGGSRAWPANFAEFAGYTGVVPALLAACVALALCLPAWRRRLWEALPEGAGRRAGFFIALVGAAVLASFRNPLGEALHSVIPGLGRFGSPGRMLALSSVAAAALAAFGTHALASEAMRSVRTRLVLSAAAALALFAAALAVPAAATLGRDAVANAGPDAARFGILLALGALILALAGGRHALDGPEGEALAEPPGALLNGSAGASPSRTRRTRMSAGLAQGLLLVLVAADLLTLGAGLLRSAPAETVYPASRLLTAIREHDPNARVLAITPNWSVDRFPLALLPPNSATYAGLNDVNGYDSLYLLHYKRLLNEMAGKETSPRANGNMTLFDAYQAPGFARLACRYVLSLQPLSGGGLRQLAEGPVKLYAATNAYPRAYVAAGPEAPPAAGSAGRLAAVAPTRVAVDLPGTPGETLVLLDTYMPGWRAAVDGRPAPVAMAQGAFRSVRITPGARQVEFRYEPAAFRVGLFMALAALAALAGAAGFSAVTKKGRLSQEGEAARR